MIGLLAGATVAATAFACTAEEASRRFDIAAQPLDKALGAFSVATGLPMLYDSALAAGKRSSAVSGQMRPREALALLLAGSGLSARFTQGGAVVVYAGSGSAVTLNPITAVATPVIGGARDDPAARSYADMVRRQIVERLRGDQVLSGGDYVLTAKVWIADGGQAGRVEIITGSGQAARDQAFVAATGAMLFPAPPPTLPQPLRMEFRVRQQR
jgi:hypothetical protein